MNIFAVVKKAINSNLNKPLDITLDEIQATVNNIRKASRKVVEFKNIPYNASSDTQVLTTANEPIFSVSGSGRILQIIPVSNLSGSTGRYGTVLLNVDGDTVINNRITYATGTSDYAGIYIVDTDSGTGGSTSIYTDIFASGGSVYVNRSRTCRANTDTYSNRSTGIYDPNGIPFSNRFDLRVTQAISSSSIDKVGVIVVYELYE
jgi:hypothetical protein